MILVDTSVWIDYLREETNDQVVWFQEVLERGFPFGLTSAVYQEVLQGAENEESFARLDEYLSTQVFYEPVDPVESYREAARLYFLCRRAGFTIRSTIDCLIARVAIEHNLMVLARDRDFHIMSDVVPELVLYMGPYADRRIDSVVNEPETPYGGPGRRR